MRISMDVLFTEDILDDVIQEYLEKTKENPTDVILNILDNIWENDSRNIDWSQIKSRIDDIQNNEEAHRANIQLKNDLMNSFIKWYENNEHTQEEVRQMLIKMVDEPYEKNVIPFKDFE